MYLTLIYTDNLTEARRLILKRDLVNRCCNSVFYLFGFLCVFSFIGNVGPQQLFSLAINLMIIFSIHHLILKVSHHHSVLEIKVKSSNVQNPKVIRLQEKHEKLGSGMLWVFILFYIFNE